MARDEHDKTTADLDLGRGAMSAAERKRAERARMRAQGYTQRQLWIKAGRPTKAAQLLDLLDRLSLDDVVSLPDDDLLQLSSDLHHWRELVELERDKRRK